MCMVCFVCLDYMTVLAYLLSFTPLSPGSFSRLSRGCDREGARPDPSPAQRSQECVCFCGCGTHPCALLALTQGRDDPQGFTIDVF